MRESDLFMAEALGMEMKMPENVEQLRAIVGTNWARATTIERERCAKIVESYIRGYKGELIAAEIRKEPA